MEMGADYIGCGPTFPSSTKSFDAFAGLLFLREVAALLLERKSNLPAFAIGGINLANLPQLLETGMTRVAVSNAIWRADSPAKAAQAFTKQLKCLVQKVNEPKNDDAT